MFNNYLKAHIAHFKGLSFDSDEWKSYLYEYFNDQVPRFYKLFVSSRYVVVWFESLIICRKPFWTKLTGILGFTNLECPRTHQSMASNLKRILAIQNFSLLVFDRFDQTLANRVIKLSEKLYNEDVAGQDPSYASFSSSQKRELLGQLLDKVRHLGPAQWRSKLATTDL